MIQKIKNSLLALSTSMVLSLGALTGFGLIASPGAAFASGPATGAPAASTCSGTGTSTTQQGCINQNLCSGSNFDLSGDQSQAIGNTTTSDCSQGTSTLSSKIKTILNLLSALIGIIAVIMIIYAGFRYVTSAGSEGGVKAAKNAIIYAIIGLVVVALAQVIVHFVITNAVS